MSISILINDLEKFIQDALEKADTTCAMCGHQLYRLDEPMETLKHPTWSRMTTHLHAGFSPGNLDGFWCNSGYTTYAIPSQPEISLDALAELIKLYKKK